MGRTPFRDFAFKKACRALDFYQERLNGLRQMNAVRGGSSGTDRRYTTLCDEVERWEKQFTEFEMEMVRVAVEKSYESSSEGAEHKDYDFNSAYDKVWGLGLPGTPN